MKSHAEIKAEVKGLELAVFNALRGLNYYALENLVGRDVKINKMPMNPLGGSRIDLTGEVIRIESIVVREDGLYLHLKDHYDGIGMKFECVEIID
jgi:hypothetical protein